MTTYTRILMKHLQHIFVLVASSLLLTAAAIEHPAAATVSTSTYDGSANLSSINQTTTLLSTTTSTTTTTEANEAAKEQSYSMAIFFILLVIAISILIIHLLIKTGFHYLPESIAVVLLGTALGLIIKLLDQYNIANWHEEEHFPPTMFFLVLLPPIIFESGYNLHKGNFFQNIGTILLFAIVGTAVSAAVLGGVMYFLGEAGLVYRLTMQQSFAFGSLISAVDPVATLAIFNALDIDPILYMLVFGESILNDAVSIVLTTTVLELSSPSMAQMSGVAKVFSAFGRFLLMFFGSATIGLLCGLISALLTKHVDLRKTPSLEIAMILVFSYAPYGLAEGMHLSGIMAILFSGITMSHYMHLNLSPVAQITVQQLFRTIAFIAETCVFAYLGLAIFSFQHSVKPAFVIWSIIMTLIGRACNIFPLAFLANYFREHKITRKMQFIMWFSGLRGAIAFALSMHLEFSQEVKSVIVTTTLIIVLFTIVCLGGSTMPLMKYLKADKRKRRKQEITMSKTVKMGENVDSEHMSELTEEESDTATTPRQLTGFMKLDAQYLIPFFTRKFTQREMMEGTNQMRTLTNQWFQEVRQAPSDSEDGEDVVLYQSNGRATSSL